LGLKWHCTAAIPLPPKKTIEEHAAKNHLVSITTTGTVSSGTMCDLLHKIAALKLKELITLMLYGRHYNDFVEFCKAIDGCLANIPNTVMEATSGLDSATSN